MAVAAASGEDLLAKGLEFESVLTKRDTSVLDSLLDSNVVLHKDAITLHDDLEGQEAVKQYYETYVRGYDVEGGHLTLDIALNEATRSVFTLSLEAGVRPKSGNTQPSDSAGIFKYVFSPEGKVTDIFFIREPGADELAKKFKEPRQLKNAVPLGPRDYKSDFSGEGVVGGKLVDVTPADSARVQQVRSTAEQYSNLYKTWPADNKEAEKLFEPNVTQLDVLFGQQSSGVAEITANIEKISKALETSEHEHDIAVTPDGNSAFIHWSNKGLLKRGQNEASRDNLKGFTLLKFETSGKGAIQTVLGFRQPTSQEREELFGEEPEVAINY